MIQETAARRKEGALDSAEVQAVSDWLIDQGLMGAGFESILSGFCERVAAIGVSLQRGLIAMRTLHPSVDAQTFTWRRGGEMRSERFVLDRRDELNWQRSPVRYMLETRSLTLRRRLDDPGVALEFPILEELRAGGSTDYYARVVPFEIGGRSDAETGLICTWATDRPAGFLDSDIAVLDRLTPRLALTAKTALTREIAENVLDTYVGPEAGERIMGGDIHRGSLDAIRAVLIYADLRGFTSMTERLERRELAAMLDEYFEHMVPPVLEHGGQVLKYIGDGLIATFNLEGQPRGSVCSGALAAACEVLARVEALNVRREGVGKPAMALDIGMHLGEVLYGNIGAADRLDFTAIGPAVNEASRIEELCELLDRNLLISSAFSAAASDCADRLVSLGRHGLRGVREEQELFTIELNS